MLEKYRSLAFENNKISVLRYTSSVKIVSESDTAISARHHERVLASTTIRLPTHHHHHPNAHPVIESRTFVVGETVRNGDP